MNGSRGPDGDKVWEGGALHFLPHPPSLSDSLIGEVGLAAGAPSAGWDSHLFLVSFSGAAPKSVPYRMGFLTNVSPDLYGS